MIPAVHSTLRTGVLGEGITAFGLTVRFHSLSDFKLLEINYPM